MRWRLFVWLCSGLIAKAHLSEMGEYQWKWHDEVRYRLAMLVLQEVSS